MRFTQILFIIYPNFLEIFLKIFKFQRSFSEYSSNLFSKFQQVLSNTLNMFHVFALAYHSTGFLWPTLLFFHCFASGSVYHHASVYTAHCECATQVRSHLSFFKLTDMWSEAGHETCSSSWVRWQEF